MKFYTYTAVFDKEPGTKSTYNVSVPALPGCLTYGESLKEAEHNIQEAMELYLETLLDDDQSLPANKKTKAKKNRVMNKDIVVSIKQEIAAGFPHYEPAVPVFA